MFKISDKGIKKVFLHIYVFPDNRANIFTFYSENKMF